MKDEGKSSLAQTSSEQINSWRVFLIFLRLGLTSFGGPIAHLGYFREEFVTRRRWLTERSYADLVALCQFLPGPASSQVGISLGLSRSGYLGGIAAWAGFTLPSAFALILFAIGMNNFPGLIPQAAIHGLKVVAVAVVIQAIWGMATTLCQGIRRITIMSAACCIALSSNFPLTQLGVIAISAIVGLIVIKPAQGLPHEPLAIPISHRAGIRWLILFFGLLIGFPLMLRVWPNEILAMIDSFYRSGSLVFGGGHVVLPLLQAETVARGTIGNETFLAGYGAAQAVPGPLFTFAAFLGAAMKVAPSPWVAGLICLLAIFAPSYLLIAGTLPFWERIRSSQSTQSALAGINAGVVGLLLAALYNLVWTSAIRQPQDFGFALVALVALMFWKAPPWLVVASSGFVGWLLSFLS